MKTLIIAEKPSMAEKVATALFNKPSKKQGYYEANDHYITYAVGHLIGLAEPEIYGNYKKWDLNVLPIIPNPFQYVADSEKLKQLNIIKKLADNASIIVNACDAGREGQYIHDLIYNYLKLTQPVKRLWVSSLTPKAIQQAYQSLQSNQQYHSLFQAADTRSKSDWLIGMNMTRAFTAKHGELLPIGRVKTPTLAMVYDRMKEIQQFKSTTYYDVVATFSQDGESYEGKLDGPKLTDVRKAQEIAKRVNKEEGKIINYQEKQEKESPPKLYDLSLLEQEASKKFGFTVKKVDKLAQALYEQHEAITYTRTDCNYVTEEDIPDMHQALTNIQRAFRTEGTIHAKKELVNKNVKRICNNDKVTDHTAILPTGKIPTNLSEDEKKIYFMIVQRFLAQFYPAANYKRYLITTEVEGFKFKTSFKVEQDKGWKVVYQKDKADKEESSDMRNKPFSINDNKPVKCDTAKEKQIDTKPPKPFTEGTLIKAMETAGKKLDNEELRDVLKESGLGTPATRSGIIEELKRNQYIEKKGRSIDITEKGISLIEMLRKTGLKTLTSAELTGKWEKELNEITKGRANPDNLLKNITQFTKLSITEVNKMESMKHKFINSIDKCPACQKGYIIEGKKAYGCTRWKEGCEFKIWKNSYNKNITPSMVKQLIEKGQTNKMKFKSKTKGTNYDARLVIKDRLKGEVKIEFINNKQKV